MTNIHLFTLLTFIAVLQSYPDTNMKQPATPQSANGLWGLSSHEDIDGLKGDHPTSLQNFIYEDECLTFRIVNIGGLQPLDADPFYKLESRWESNELHYRAPSGRWQPFAIFEDGQFIMQGHGRQYHFVKIEPAEIAEWNHGLIDEKRKPHVYTE